MVITALIYVIYVIVLAITAPLFLFDDVTLISGAATAISTIADYIALFNAIIPFTPLLIGFTLFLAILVIIGIYKIFMLVKSFIPFISG